jgi:hypothetical protein
VSWIRLRCDPARLGDPRAHVRDLHGPSARLVRIDEVRVGGIAGFFARRYLDLVVELPEPDLRPFGADTLDEGDVGPEPETLSTEGAGFGRVLGDLESMLATRRPLGRSAAVPRISVLRRAPGDLVMIAGLLGEALPVAAHLAGATGILRIGGGLESRAAGRIDDRRGAVLQKAEAENAELPVFLAWGLGSGDPAHVAADNRVRQIAPDKLWVVIDPARKHDDTKAWVAALARHRPVDAYLPLAGPHTASAGTVGLLGLPRGEPGAVG